MDKFDANRRKLLALGGVALGAAAILPTPAFATLSTPRPRILTLNNLHTGETLKAEFFDGRGYIQDELARLNHFSVISARIKSKPSTWIIRSALPLAGTAGDQKAGAAHLWLSLSGYQQ